MKCTYCGEEEATEVIMNPNHDEDEATWDVCKDCKEMIVQQQKLSFGAILSSIENKTEKAKGFNQEYGGRIMSEANAEIEKISKRTGKPAISAMIYKNKDGGYSAVSVEHTGD